MVSPMWICNMCHLYIYRLSVIVLMKDVSYGIGVVMYATDD